MLFRRSLGWIGLAAWLSAALPLMAAEPKEKAVGVAHIKLSGTFDEAPPSSDPLFGTARESFQSKLQRIRKAKTDADIQALYLHIQDLHGVGWGKLHELRRALADFRKSGKKAYAYLDGGESIEYLIAAACDEVCLPESGWLLLIGLRGGVTFYKDLLDKLGVKADMLQMGSFKGAAEPMTRSSMSPQLRQQIEGILDDHFEKDLIGLIAKSRGGKKLSAARVRQLIDEGPYTAQAALTAGLIDRVAYPDAFQEHIKQALKTEKIKLVHDYAKPKNEDIDFSDLFSILKLFKPPKASSSKKPKLAVIYASGVIVMGRGGESLFEEEACGATTLIEAIRQAEEDKTVKAIVLRVDSPGGSALASDLIWNELARCKKPVVASMSDVAASGGYYISMAARKIYAEPGTLTGSIGVVGGKMVVGGLFGKVGVRTEVITRGANAGLFAGDAPFSDSERRAMTALMSDTYRQFLDKAIQGRAKAGKEFTRENISRYAEGRVWTGRQAKRIGLVDALGTLDDALAAAQQMAGIAKEEKLDLLMLPKQKSFIEQLFDTGSLSVPTGTRGLPILRGLPELTTRLRSVDTLLRLRGEPVWLLLPGQIEVR